MLSFNSFLDSFWKKKWLPYAVLTLIVFAVYARTIGFNFTYLDDNTLILNNYRFISEPANILKTFGRDVFHGSGSDAFYYRPFLTIYFMIGAFIGGQSPVGYHFLNILVHLATVFLLFIFLQKLQFNRIVSFFVSLIFAVHPVLTQAVAWIPGSNDSLVAMFVLASFIFFIDYLGSGKWKYLFWNFIFWLSALFTKETAVFAPILFIIYALLQKRKFTTSDKNADLSRLLFAIIGWLSVFIFWFLLRDQALGGRLLGMPVISAFSSIFNNLPSVFLYIGKALFPVNLSVFPFLLDQTFVYGYCATVFIILALYLSYFGRENNISAISSDANRRKINWKNIIFGTTWFLVFLIPSFLRPNLQVAPDLLEHRIYLPIIGFFIVILEIDWAHVGRRLSHFIKISSQKINYALLFLLVAVLAITTFFYSQNFRDKISFWTDAVKNSPHAPLAHRNLGAMYWLDGEADMAKPEYEKALELNPNEQMAHNNLGLIYAQKGDYQSAINEYQAELKTNPYYDNALYNEGLAYWNMGKKDEAAKNWEETINVNPDYLDAYKALIAYYQEKGDSKTAGIYYSKLQEMSQ